VRIAALETAFDMLEAQLTSAPIAAMTAGS
jgi:hypothetical protein